MAFVVVLNILVADEIRSVFVDCVVSKVHFVVSDVTFIGVFVFGSCQSAQTFLVDVDSERVQASEHDIDSEVKLGAIKEHGVGDVLLDNDLIFGGECWMFGEVYSSSLAVGMRLDDVGGIACPAAECFEVLRKHPGGRVEFIEFRHGCLCPVEVEGKEVLPSKFAAAGEMVDLLVAF